MSAGLITQWHDRIVETETLISVVEEDISALAKKRKEIKQEMVRHDKTVNCEKKELLKQLESVEKQARKFEVDCENTTTQKALVEKLYIETLDDYEAMHGVVKAIQLDERYLQEREDLEAVLQRESAEWTEEEHAHRNRLNVLQSSLRASREHRQEEIRALEKQLAEAERQLEQGRLERQKEMQQRLQGNQSTMHCTNAITAPHTFFPVGCARRKCRSRFRHQCSQSTTAAIHIDANASAGVPTRQLRSCLKQNSSFNNASQGCDHNARPTTFARGINGQCASAPTSRAISQTLVEDGTGQGVFAGLPSAVSQRAFSYANTWKGGSRKRGILRDATNQ
uniref:Uncharacterized protein n=1 Tax=Trypanosoma vivax (strain Y486) TaxID=1055687 RepID=G0U054_TRYVY|nr:conserved hypothetical protein, fragment [Trypanosoma vivax Y486]